MTGRAKLTAIVFWRIVPGIDTAKLADDNAASFGACTQDSGPISGTISPRRWANSYHRRGSACAQTWICVMHSEGSGVAKDHTEAIRWLSRAAS